GPRHHREGAGLAASPRIAERHVGRRLFMPRMDDPDLVAGVVERHKERIVLHAGQREQRVDPMPGQHLDQGAAARHPRHAMLLGPRPGSSPATEHRYDTGGPDRNIATVVWAPSSPPPAGGGRVRDFALAETAT